MTIDLGNFDNSSDSGLIPKANTGVFNNDVTDDIFEKRGALVHDNTKNVTSVRFAPSDNEEGNTQL